MFRIVCRKDLYRSRMVFAVAPFEVHILRVFLCIEIIDFSETSQEGCIRSAESQFFSLYHHRQIIRQHQNRICPYTEPVKNDLLLLSLTGRHCKFQRRFRCDPFLRHFPFSLVIINKQEAAIRCFIIAEGRPQCLHILCTRRPRYIFRQICFCRCQQFFCIFDKNMVFPQSVIAFRRQSVLPQAGLEIIAFHRKVIGIAGSFRLLQGGIFPVGIHAAVIHIISDQICPGSQHTDRLCLDVLRIRVGASMCRHLQSPSQFRRQVRGF